MTSAQLSVHANVEPPIGRQIRPVVVAVYAILAIVVILSLYPFVMMFVNSFKSDTEILANPSALPRIWTLDSYGSIFTFHNGIWINFLNSVIIAGTSTVLAVLMTSMAAFAFSKYRFRGRNHLFTLLMLTLMVPSQITIPPLFILFSRLGWINTLQVQIIPTVTSVFGLFMIRQYMLGVPNELLEAARIDGAGHWQLFARIMIPVSAPILGAFAILHFLGVWNSYLWPLLVANDSRVQPILVTLPNMTDPNLGFLPVWGTIMAGCVLATLPILIVFVAFQDKFMSSAVVGAIRE
jgi:ABC-type glycerol-3-phosphate transport system permease component